mgnify:CR=1 FL=1
MLKKKLFLSCSLMLLAACLSGGTPCLAQEGDAKREKQMQDAQDQVMKAVKRPIKDKWAVVIGVDRFVDPRIPHLRYASKDAQDFAKFLVEKANFAPDHVLLLLNEDATQRNIRSAIGDLWLPRRVLDDDLVVLYASTHGSPKELDVGGDNFLIAHDTKQDELWTTGIQLKDLAPVVEQRTHCDRVVLILDACNSGAAEAGGKGLYRATNFDLEAVAGKGKIVISSSDSNQRSWESKRYENGVFTHSLIEVLEKSKDGQSSGIEAAFDTLKDKVQSEVRFDRKAFQTPVMHSKWQGDPLVLTAKPVAPRDVDADDDNPYTFSNVIKRGGKPLALAETKATPVTPPVATPTPPVVQTTPQVVSTPPVQPAPVQTVPVQTQTPPVQTGAGQQAQILGTSTTSTVTAPVHIPTKPAGKEVDYWEKFKMKMH